MVEMYVRLILQGKRYFGEVPENIKEQVKEQLIKIDRKDLLEV